MVFRHESCAADKSNSYCWAPFHSRYQPQWAKTQPIKLLLREHKVSLHKQFAQDFYMVPHCSELKSKTHKQQQAICFTKTELWRKPSYCYSHSDNPYIFASSLYYPPHWMSSKLMPTSELNRTESYYTNNIQVTYTQHHECPWPQHDHPAHEQHMHIKNTWKIN